MSLLIIYVSVEPDLAALNKVYPAKLRIVPSNQRKLYQLEQMIYWVLCISLTYLLQYKSVMNFI